jgi:nucleotide-binding universal stress UspA family protein
VDGTVEGDFAHIACCVEESPGSRIALAHARRLRAVAPGRLSVVHVFEPGMPMIDPGFVPVSAEADPEGETRRWLAALAAETPGAEAVLLAGGGRAGPSAVCAWAGREGVDLLIAGALRGRLDRALRGDFTGYLVKHAPCSVLVVRPRE